MKLIAPNGKKSNLTAEQYKLVRTDSFKKWFGDWENDKDNASKVIDENGEPMVVYHGTKNIFNKFIEDKPLIGWLGKGFYFTDNKKLAKNNGKIIYQVFLNVKNPFKVVGQDSSDVRYEVKKRYNSSNEDFYDDVSITLKEKKYNGVFFKHWEQGRYFSCFYSNQIKLADGSNTNFDNNNPDIRFGDGGTTTWFKYSIGGL